MVLNELIALTERIRLLQEDRPRQMEQSNRTPFTPDGHGRAGVANQHYRRLF